MADRWVQADLADDDPWPRGDPAEVVDALAELLGGRRPEWHRRAACRGAGVAAWFPERGANVADETRALCAGCPVQVECADAGMGERHGLWGGLTARDRSRLRRTIAEEAA